MRAIEYFVASKAYRRPRSRLARYSRVGAAALAATAISWCLAAPSWADASRVRVQLSSATVAADGVSQVTATATVSDQSGNLVANDPVTFSASDPGDTVGPVTNNPDGTYSTTVTTSTTPGHVTITATDTAVTPNVSGQATFEQDGASGTLLAVAPSSAVTNQTVSLVAAVSSAATGAPFGTVTFENGGTPIAGCVGKAITDVSPTATCSTSFGASAGTAQLSAVFSPAAASTFAGSSATASLAVGIDSTAIALRASNPTPKVGASEPYIATINPAHTGPLSPSGSVSFLDGGRPIAGCQAQPVTGAGGSASASCAVIYSATGSHSISATYGGDANFAGSSSAPVGISVAPLGKLGAAMRWSFLSTSSYTRVLALAITGATSGSSLVLTCHGRGCPFSSTAISVTKSVRCSAKGKAGCPSNGTLNLTSRFGGHRLRPGATITVEILRPGWIGRTYTFVVQAHRPPRVQSACVAPGGAAASAC